MKNMQMAEFAGLFEPCDMQNSAERSKYGGIKDGCGAECYGVVA